MTNDSNDSQGEEFHSVMNSIPFNTQYTSGKQNAFY